MPVLREEIIAAAVEEVGRVVLDALARGEAPTADALRLLLRGYATTGRDDFRDALEPGLALALEISADSSSADRPGWLILFAEAADASEDARLVDVATDLATKARMTWGGKMPLVQLANSIDAYLRTIALLAREASISDQMQPAIDQLEHIASHYEPGQGLSDALGDQMSVAGALLTAFQYTARLPYSMLAEELVQQSRRALWDANRPSFEVSCAAASVLCRLAALHQSEEYRAAAVIAPAADYAADAARILEDLAPAVPGRGLAGAAYGLAAGELQSLFPWP